MINSSKQPNLTIAPGLVKNDDGRYMQDAAQAFQAIPLPPLHNNTVRPPLSHPPPLPPPPNGLQHRTPRSRWMHHLPSSASRRVSRLGRQVALPHNQLSTSATLNPNTTLRRV